MKIKYEYAFSYREIMIDVIIDDLDENLLEICENNIEGKHIFSFSHYYGKSENYAVEDMVPYILKNGYYIWNVPYKEVNVKDFLNTHNLNLDDTLIVDVDNVGSGPVFLQTLYQGWVQFGTIACQIVDWIGRGITVAAIVKYVSNSFAKGKKNKPTISSLYQFLTSRDRWDKSKLEKSLNVDSLFLDYILTVFGFELDSNNKYYVFNENKNEIFLDAQIRNNNKFFDNHGTNINFYSVNESIENINIQLLYFNIICSNQYSKNWILEKERLIKFVEDNNKYLEIGLDDTYIQMKNLSKEDIFDNIENDLWIILNNYNDELLERILIIEKQMEK